MEDNANIARRGLRFDFTATRQRDTATNNQYWYPLRSDYGYSGRRDYGYIVHSVSRALPILFSKLRSQQRNHSNMLRILSKSTSKSVLSPEWSFLPFTVVAGEIHHTIRAYFLFYFPDVKDCSELIPFRLSFCL